MHYENDREAWRFMEWEEGKSAKESNPDIRLLPVDPSLENPESYTFLLSPALPRSFLDRLARRGVSARICNQGDTSCGVDHPSKRQISFLPPRTSIGLELQPVTVRVSVEIVGTTRSDPGPEMPGGGMWMETVDVTLELRGSEWVVVRKSTAWIT
ncbi:MAG: hypothetical protein H0V09_11700 [Gemmatimonadetes bacterium]|nr:hypothetical protein [Gemmatimonadota bacterium]